VDIRGDVTADEKRRKTTTIITLETMTTDPWMLFLYALKAPATRDKYIQRLTKFLDFLGYKGTKEEKARAFAAQARADPIYAFNTVLKFFQIKREQMVLMPPSIMVFGTVKDIITLTYFTQRENKIRSGWIERYTYFSLSVIDIIHILFSICH
jgi:hypothetical protein